MSVINSLKPVKRPGGRFCGSRFPVFGFRFSRFPVFGFRFSRFPVFGFRFVWDRGIECEYLPIKNSPDGLELSGKFFKILRCYFSVALLYLFHHFCKLFINWRLYTIFLPFSGNITIVIIYFCLFSSLN